MSPRRIPALPSLSATSQAHNARLLVVQDLRTRAETAEGRIVYLAQAFRCAPSALRSTISEEFSQLRAEIAALRSAGQQQIIATPSGS